MASRLHLELAAAPLGVQSARGAITRLCRELRIKDEFADDVRLAVTEASANCVLHTYRAGAPASMFVLDASVDEETLLVVVQDEAGGIVRGPAMLGGLGIGLRLIDLVADGMEVSSRPGGSQRLAMRFAMARRLATSPQSPE